MNKIISARNTLDMPTKAEKLWIYHIRILTTARVY